MRADSVQPAVGISASRAPTGGPSPVFAIAWRYAVGLFWSLAMAAGGAWLVLSPWAVGGQGNAAWSSETVTLVATGAGLLLLAALGVLLVALEVASFLTGGVEPAQRRRQEPPESRPEAERALVQLAQVLTRQLEREEAAGAGEEPSKLPEPDRERAVAVPTTDSWRDLT